MSEKDQFLKDLEPKEKVEDGKVDLFEAPLNPEEPKPEEGVEPKKDEEEEVPDDVKNRRHRRLERDLKAEREANIAMAARLETLSEVKKFTEETSSDEHLKSIERIYGTDSPEAVAATELLKGALVGVQKKATEDALEIFRKEQREAVEAVRGEEKALDSMLEELEEEYNIDLTSPKSEEVRKGFFKRLEKLSPKDKDGNILHYADHHAVWEDFQAQIQKKTDNNTRAKDLSDRSMVHSSTAEVKNQGSAEEKWLKENGIL